MSINFGIVENIYRGRLAAYIQKQNRYFITLLAARAHHPPGLGKPGGSPWESDCILDTGLEWI